MPAYSVWIKRRGKLIYFEDSFLPEVRIPTKSLELMRVEVVDKKLRLCDACYETARPGNFCHVMMWVQQKYTGKWVQEKYCPILFCDALKPPWKVEELC